MKQCAWLGADGRCQHEGLCQYRKRRMICKHPKHKCRLVITESKLRKKLTKEANDRPLTDDTRHLIHRYHSEGMSSLLIAFILNRSPAAVEAILQENITQGGTGNEAWKKSDSETAETNRSGKA